MASSGYANESVYENKLELELEESDAYIGSLNNKQYIFSVNIAYRFYSLSF